jgi:hypothetical protein
MNIGPCGIIDPYDLSALSSSLQAVEKKAKYIPHTSPWISASAA